MWGWKPYVPIATRIAKAKNKMNKLKKKGKIIEPIEIKGRKIAQKFWGIKWCEHLESFSDYENRLPRGRSYVRNGSVCHLKINKGYVEAYVSGSSLYKVEIKITPMDNLKWESMKKKCNNHIGSLLELLNGNLSDHVMNIVANPNDGLFPNQKEINFSCDCPDWAYMCKHIAAVLYGIGSRLDEQPDLLFLLRGVNASELITTKLHTITEKTDEILLEKEISNIFDIEIEDINKSLINTPLANKEKKLNSISKINKIKKKTRKTDSKINITDLSKFTATDLINLRTKLNLSAKKFAKKLEVSITTLYNWQKKKGILSLKKRNTNIIAKLLKKNDSF